MRNEKMKCDECGQEFTTHPISKGRSIFCTVYGKFCTDWGQQPDTGCWPKIQARNVERVAAECGRPGNIEKYWEAYGTEKFTPLLWELLSKEQRAIVSAEHDRRKIVFREALPPVFEVGTTIWPFGKDGEPFSVVCRMRHHIGPQIHDMYYISWKSAQNSGEDAQYEELLFIHRRPDYAQPYAVEEVSFVCLKERTKLPGGVKLVSLDKMFDSK